MKHSFNAAVGTILLLSLSLTSCGTDHLRPVENALMSVDVSALTAINLSERTPEEVIQIKYKKAALNCSLWVQSGDKLDKTQSPNDSFSIDLLKNAFTPDTQKKLSVTVGDQIVDAVVTLKDLKINDTDNYKRDERTTYKMKYSPIILLDFDYDYKNKNGPLSLSSDGHQERVIREKIKDVALNISNGTDSEKYFVSAECLIDTDLRSQFQDHFVIEEN